MKRTFYFGVVFIASNGQTDKKGSADIINTYMTQSMTASPLKHSDRRRKRSRI